MSDERREWMELVADLRQQLAAAEAAIHSRDFTPCKHCEENVQLKQQLATTRGLLETACDAWECGMMVSRPACVVPTNFKTACLPRDWYERSKKEVSGEQ